MGLYEKLPDCEKNVIGKYIDTYVDESNNQERAETSYLLRFWDKNKEEYLYKLLGNQFIYKKEIKVEKSIDVLAEEIGDKLYERSPMRTFMNRMKDYFADHTNILDTDERVMYYNICNLFNSEYLATNCYKGNTWSVITPDEHKITVLNGCRPVKMLGKIADAYGIEGFEDFRIAHSLITNQKMLKGNLCLSIHPLDYMTMSDNECDWESCMSWQNRGCYRRGTVEMMNSNKVIVAYLTAEDPMNLFGTEWSNKKWRQLFTVTHDFAMGIKAYPYHNDEITKAVLDTIRELAKENLGWDFGDCFNFEHSSNFNLDGDVYNIRMSTNTMYNDCGTVSHWGMFNTDVTKYHKYDETTTRVRYDTICYSTSYSGPEVCMCCGSTEGCYDDEGCLTCCDCYNLMYCYACEGRYPQEDMYELDGEYYCRDCYENYCQYEPLDSCDHHQDNFGTVYVLPDGYIEHCKAIGEEPDFSYATGFKMYKDYIVDGHYKLNQYFKLDDSELFNHYERRDAWYNNTRYYIYISDILDKGWDYIADQRSIDKEDMEARLMRNYFNLNFSMPTEDDVKVQASIEGDVIWLKGSITPTSRKYCLKYQVPKNMSNSSTKELKDLIENQLTPELKRYVLGQIQTPSQTNSQTLSLTSPSLQYLRL